MSYQLLQIPVSDRKKISIQYYQTIGSTNTEAVNLARQGVEEWTVVAAAEQTAGKGRFQRQWISQAGAGLWFSVIFRPRIETKKINLLNLTTAIILRDFLEGIIRSSSIGKEYAVELKWPNDILVDKRKMVGLLFESAFSSKRVEYVVAGIGINVHQSRDDFPPDLQESAISLKMVTAKNWDLTELLKQFLEYYYLEYNQAERIQFQNVITRYEKYLLSKNKKIKIKLAANEIVGILKGINSSGHLILEVGGQVKEITSGDLWTINKVEHP
ncbi:MAG: biotin--[acetyl-CoA-carboxylase] ligase [Caldithrix sp. RBG_13_44_9]|nr:MAG: biotin--[acetyl-CoA-carboxylase] ligase [Caldithrix sp. RBG_13_44_9]